MSMPNSALAEPEKKNSRRKVKAIAAAGTVLGIGAAVTLANWTDMQFAEGFFGIGHYQVVSSVDNSTYLDHDGDSEDNGIATLTFAAENIVPEEEFAAGFWLRTDEDTSYDGVIETLTVDDATGSPADFGLQVLQIPEDATCEHGIDSSDVLETIVADGQLTSEASDLGIDLTNIEDAEGDPVQLCFLVDAPEQSVLANATDTTVTWAVQTASVDN